MTTEKLSVIYIRGYDPEEKVTVESNTPFQIKTDKGTLWVEYIYIKNGHVIFQVSENF